MGDFRFNRIGDGTARTRLARHRLISLLHIRGDLIDEAVKAVCGVFWLWLARWCLILLLVVA